MATISGSEPHRHGEPVLPTSTEAAVDSGERNWAEMQWDVLSVIFAKLGAVHVLYTAQSVCRLWRNLSRDPRIWKSVDFSTVYDGTELEKMLSVAVDRSAGLMERLSMGRPADDEPLIYMADRTSNLRCLRILTCNAISDEVMIELAKKLPLLEELELSYGFFSTEVYESVGRSCQLLRCFCSNRDFRFPFPECNGVAFAIGKNMTELCELQITGNMLSNEGLQAILDGCPHLESLDLRQCFNVNLDDPSWKKKCASIRNLRLPKDCCGEYGDDYDDDFHSSDYNGMLDFDGGMYDMVYGISDGDAEYDDIFCGDYDHDDEYFL